MLLGRRRTTDIVDAAITLLAGPHDVILTRDPATSQRSLPPLAPARSFVADPAPPWPERLCGAL
jgi:hypothetical protein